MLHAFGEFAEAMEYRTMPRIDWNALSDLRWEAAEREWDRYDFGEYQPEEKSGWEHSSGPGVSEWIRPVFYVNPEDPEGPTDRGTFTVVFAPETNEVMDAYGRINGEDIGDWPGPSGFVPAPTPMLPNEEAVIDRSAFAADGALDELRGDAAAAEFANYDFEDWKVEDADGWERSTENGETRWRRAVYFENPSGSDADTLRGDFTVIFADRSAEVVTAYAGVNGNDIGGRPSPSPSP